MGKKAEILLKKPLSPFFLFRSEVYDQVKTDNPEAKVS
jgi:hypothetical protein